MKVIIQPSVISLNKNEKDNYFILASEYEIIYDEKGGFTKLAESLYKDRIFDLSGCSISGKRTQQGTVYSVTVKGSDTIDWTISLLKWIKKARKNGIDVQLNVSKTSLKSHGVSDLSLASNLLSPKMQDMVIDSYIMALYSIANCCKMDDLLVSKVRKCDSNLRVDISFDKMYIL